MTTPIQGPNLQDDRWGGYVPWFLRHPDLRILGQFDLFFDRVAHRLKQFFLYGEGGSLNLGHMGARIESESHQCFRISNDNSLAWQIQSFFSPAVINLEVNNNTISDPQITQADTAFKNTRTRLFKKFNQDITKIMKDPTYVTAQEGLLTLSSTRHEYYRGRMIHGRLTVLESVLRLVQETPGFRELRADLRRYLGEAQIMLDIAEKGGSIVPMEEALLRKEVLDRLLPRLANRYPQQEKDLVKAYHDLVQGVETDAIFVLAVKALEEIARKVSGRPNLTLDDYKNLKAAFPNLHPTIHTTIIKLTAHRGDKGAHGRQGPPPHEMRYLLFSICNVALLFLDYPTPTTPASTS